MNGSANGYYAAYSVAPGPVRVLCTVARLDLDSPEAVFHDQGRNFMQYALLFAPRDQLTERENHSFINP